jgi:hypothetical protein
VEERGDPMIFNQPKQVAASLLFCLLLVFGLLLGIQRGVAGLQNRNKSENAVEQRLMKLIGRESTGMFSRRAA